MHLRLPKASIFDKFLRVVGKKRVVYFPALSHAEHCQLIGKKENFLRALFRPKSKEIKEDALHVFSNEDLC